MNQVLFRPELIDKDSEGIHKSVLESIMKCYVSGSRVLRELYFNIVLSGGTTMIRGLEERLSKEMIALAPASIGAHVVSPPERKYSAWIGGSILGSLSTFQEMWISKDEYNESGTGIVHRKCF